MWNSNFVFGAATDRRQTIRWQLCAGWRTGEIGTRQTRRSPTHSHHKSIWQAQKKRLLSGGAPVRQFHFRVAKPASLILQRRPENSARFWDVQLFERLALALDAKYI